MDTNIAYIYIYNQGDGLVPKTGVEVSNGEIFTNIICMQTVKYSPTFHVCNESNGLVPITDIEVSDGEIGTILHVGSQSNGLAPITEVGASIAFK